MPFVHLERELWDLRDAAGREITPDAPERRGWLLERGTVGVCRLPWNSAWPTRGRWPQPFGWLDRHFTPVLAELICAAVDLDVSALDLAGSGGTAHAGRPRPRRRGFAEEVLLVSELVTNAVKATAGHDQAAVRLRLSGDNARVLIEVWDADPQPPVSRDLGEDGTPDPQEEGGRGLFLVAALSIRWDWYLTQEPTGKVVWCELSAEPHEPSEGTESAPQVLLPRRIPREQQKQPIEVMRDPDVLHRLRDRLRDLIATLTG